MGIDKNLVQGSMALLLLRLLKRKICMATK